MWDGTRFNSHILAHRSHDDSRARGLISVGRWRLQDTPITPDILDKGLKRSFQRLRSSRYLPTPIYIQMARQVLVGFGVDVDAVAGW